MGKQVVFKHYMVLVRRNGRHFVVHRVEAAPVDVQHIPQMLLEQTHQRKPGPLGLGGCLVGADHRNEIYFLRHGQVAQLIQRSEFAGISAIYTAYTEMPVEAGVAKDHAAPLDTAKIVGRHNSAELGEVGTRIFFDFRRFSYKQDASFAGNGCTESRRGFVKNHQPRFRLCGRGQLCGRLRRKRKQHATHCAAPVFGLPQPGPIAVDCCKLAKILGMISQCGLRFTPATPLQPWGHPKCR